MAIDPDERQAFLEAIRDAGDDPSGALVYADFLDDNGEGERAEFIRDYCEWEKMPYWHQQRDRHQRLLADRGQRLGLSRVGRHGLIWGLSFGRGDLMAQMTALQQTEPACSVSFSPSSAGCDTSGWRLGSLRGVSLPARGWLPIDAFTTASGLRGVTCPPCYDLERFAPLAGVRNFRAENWGCNRTLGRLPFEKLTELEIFRAERGPESDDDWRVAGLSPNSRRLASVRLYDATISAAAAADLAVSEAFPSLEELKLFRFAGDDRGAVAAGRSFPWMRRLRSLHVSRLSAGQLLELSAMCGPPLRTLTVGELGVDGPRDAAAMAFVMRIHSLEKFFVNALSEVVTPADFLAGFTAGPSLRELGLPFPLSPPLVEALDGQRWPCVKRLQVGLSRVANDPAAVEMLERSTILEGISVEVIGPNNSDRRIARAARRSAGRIRLYG